MRPPVADYGFALASGAKLRPIIAAMEARQRKLGTPPMRCRAAVGCAAAQSAGALRHLFLSFLNGLWPNGWSWDRPRDLRAI